MRGEQALFNLKIKKKSGLSINPDIHHSKVFSSGLGTLEWITLIRISSVETFNLSPHTLFLSP